MSEPCAPCAIVERPRASRAARPTTASIVALLIGGTMAMPAPAGAAAQPTGTISCSIAGPASVQDPKHAIFFRPAISSTARGVRLVAVNGSSACDDSGVTGDALPITTVALKFSGKLLSATCGSLTSAPEFASGHVTVRWQGLNPEGRKRTVAASRAKLASASYDAGTNALTLVMQPIASGAFVGGTITLALGFDIDAATFNANCGVYVAMPFGVANPSIVGV